MLDVVDGLESETPIFRTGLDGDPEDAFAALMDVLDGGTWEWADYALVVDEASFLQKPQFVHPALARLIRQAPDDITVVQTLHRPSETHPTVRSLSTDLFFFQNYLARDLDVIGKDYGIELAEAVRKLPQYHVIHWWLAPGGAPCWEVWNDPKLWFVDIGVKMPKKDEETKRDEPDEPEGVEGQPDAEGTPDGAETRGKDHSDDDPVRELLRVNRREISRLEKQNDKLRQRVRKMKQTKPLTPGTPGDTPSTEVPEIREPGLLDSLWKIITG